eukprot:scaffold516_cov401-Prasinococcus_capsulatus_cf.AAC.20
MQEDENRSCTSDSDESDDGSMKLDQTRPGAGTSGQMSALGAGEAHSPYMVAEAPFSQPLVPLPAPMEGGTRSLSCKDTWCATTPTLPFPQFVAGAFMVAIGYAVCAVMITIVLASQTGPSMLSIVMGWTTMANGIARTFGPAMVTAVYARFGPQVIFPSIGGLMLLNLLLCIATYHRMEREFNH